ncbi:Streptomyces sporulation and cell division protein, SsgA OS=Streptomyces microflavus OX=1919 GN=Smic_31510 PE=3 SV=1 [Streptomyces microflavus]
MLLHSTDGVEVFQFEIRTLIRFLARTRAQAPAMPAPPEGTAEKPPSRTHPPHGPGARSRPTAEDGTRT